MQDAGTNLVQPSWLAGTSINTCKERYAIFKQHYPATLRLKQYFSFHLIDAMGSLSETQEAIAQVHWAACPAFANHACPVALMRAAEPAVLSFVVACRSFATRAPSTSTRLRMRAFGTCRSPRRWYSTPDSSWCRGWTMPQKSSHTTSRRCVSLRLCRTAHGTRGVHTVLRMLRPLWCAPVESD
eukprot:130806-Chlamydomonas_euryale.AAC.4